MSNRFKGVLAIMLMLLGCGGAAIVYGSTHDNHKTNSYQEELAAAPVETEPLVHINEDFSVDESFSSHLPIVIIDTEGVEPPIYMEEDAEQERFVMIEGMEPYVDGTISIINNGEGLNYLTDTPEVSSDIRIKRRGNSSMMYEKAQWMVKLVTDSGQDNDIDVLGMGAEHEWILNGAMFDKSLLRNYLAYSIASEFIGYTPDSHYCEVIIRNGDTYEYEGVYLLMESIKQGEDRVAISEYKSDDMFNSYLLRRDRFDEDANILDTYGREQGYSKEYFELLYPSKLRVTEDMILYAQEDINAIEQVIYSDDPDVFATYPDVIDVDSFVDYFLFNEFFISYDSGNYSTYCYKDLGGKLTMGPVWDYDGTMDNYKKEAVDTDALAFQTKPWFDRLCSDQAFIEKLEKRYIALRRGALSEDHVIGKIDEIVAHLGGAQERDWYRWGHWYTTENKYSLLAEETEDGEVLIRNATTYQDEIYRIKVALREHGDYIPAALQELEKSTEVTTGFESWMGWLLLLTFGVLFIPATYVGMRK